MVRVFFLFFILSDCDNSQNYVPSFFVVVDVVAYFKLLLTHC